MSKKIASSILSILICLPVTALGVDSRVDDLENLVLDQYLDHSAWLTNISDNAVSMYMTWPHVDGLLTLFEATGNTEYVEYAVEYCNRYLSLGTKIDDDEYLDWWSSWGPENNFSHAHVEWRAGAALARTMKVVFSNSTLQAYLTDAVAIRDAVIMHVWEKWTGGYSNKAKATKSGDGMGRFGNIALALYQVTGETQYRDYVINRGTEMKDSLLLNDQEAYYWNMFFDGDFIRDVSHAGDQVNFLVEAYLAGLVFDETDIERTVNTVKKNLWDGSLSYPLFAEFVDGSGDVSDHSIGQRQGGWAKLAQFDSELQQIYFNALMLGSFRHNGSSRNTQISGNLARSIFLANEAPETDTAPPAAPKGLHFR